MKFLLVLCFCVVGFNFSAQIIRSIAGIGIASYGGDGGSAIAAQISNPTAIAFDSFGNKYIADYNNNRIRKIDVSGVISTVAGTGTFGFSGDGGLATNAKLGLPAGIAFDSNGNMYIADHVNHRIRKVSTSGIISTVVGTGFGGFSGDGGLATNAQINAPTGVAFDAFDNMYISDRNNNRIRIVDNLGIISTFAGTGTFGFNGDGGLAINASLASPNSAVAFDADGNVYIADRDNYRVRKVDDAGKISTVAGIGISGFSGNGGLATAAKLSTVFGVAFDSYGNLYIADFDNNRIRMVNSLGIISTYAGTGIAGFSGDGGAPTLANLNSPAGVNVDGSNNVYIPDAVNQRVREISKEAVSILEIEGANTSLIYPNPANSYLAIENDLLEEQIIKIYDVTGKLVLNEKYIGKVVIDLLNFDSGSYCLIIETNNKKLMREKLLIAH